jgi:hypothetical protein
MAAGLHLGTKRRAPAAIAAVTYALGFGLAYLLVREDLRWMCGPEPVCIWHSGPWKFWLSMPVFPAGIAWFVAWRLLNGPKVEREQLALFFHATPAVRALRLQVLFDGLIAAGHPLQPHRVDDALTTGTVATGNEPLLGCNVVLQDPTLKARRAHLRLILGSGQGILEIVDTGLGHYAKMGSAALLALSRHIPDLAFRRLDSALAPTPAATCSPARAPWAGA